MYQNTDQPQTYVSPRVEVRPLLRNVYALMSLGLLVTAAVAYLTANTPALRSLLGYPLVVFAAFILQLLLVGTLAVAVQRLSVPVARM